MNSTTNTRPERTDGSRNAILADDRGVTVYANKAGLTSLARQLLWIADARPEDCYECHVRMHLGDTFGAGNIGDVSVVIEKEVAGF